MPPRAPLHVPAEVGKDRRRRWFRLTEAVGVDGLSLAHALPEELDGPVTVAFHLPGDADPIQCRGRMTDEVVGERESEHVERRGIVFVDIQEPERARIANYVSERLGPQ
jgi:hypothetical protein